MRQQGARVAALSAYNPIANVIRDKAFPYINILGSNALHVSICFLGGFCCFLPLVLRVKSNMEETPLKKSFTNGHYFRDSSVASLALATPLALDIIIDLVITLVRRIRVISTDCVGSQTCLNNMEKFLCLIGIIVVPLTAFLPDNLSNVTLIFICCNKCQSFVVGATVMISICRCNRNLWSVMCTLAFLLLMTFAQITSTFSLNTAMGERHGSINDLMVAASDISTLMAVSVVLAWSFRSLFYLFCQAYRDLRSVELVRPNETSSERHGRTHVFFSICWLSVFVAGITTLVTISRVYGSIENWTGFALLLNNVTYLTFELSITILTMRMVKFDVVKGLYSLIESKKSYVRYISHELRTPLNTAFLGLKLLTDDMKESEDPKDADRYDTLRDVNLSCKAAVDILNDLLCFDKLESGILELHKQETNVIPFVTECVAMFAAQARANDIKVHFINSEVDPVQYMLKRSFSSLECEERKEGGRRTMSPPIDHTEAVFIDKFKMDQVVRNLISNALKFTPRGGSITVRIAHLPNADPSFCPSRRKPTGKRRSGTASTSTVDVVSVNDSVESGLSGALLEGTLVLEVTDTGAGISPENQKRLFNDIVQFNPEILQAGGGSGLGLWITKGIVDLHGGKISVYSEGEGKGSKFTVEVPMDRRSPRLPPLPFAQPSTRRIFVASSCFPSGSETSLIEETLSSGLDLLFTNTNTRMKARDRNRDESDSIPDATATGRTPELLVVDDSRLNRKMLCKILRGAGYICDEAEDGLLAVAKVEEKMATGDEWKRSYDAVLMDYVMPNMDGPTATKIIRSLGYSAPVFGVTGNALDSDVQYFTSCGADRIFTKPLDVAEFQNHMNCLSRNIDNNYDTLQSIGNADYRTKSREEKRGERGI